jgi:hypothetical protein
VFAPEQPRCSGTSRIDYLVYQLSKDKSRRQEVGLYGEWLDRLRFFEYDLVLEISHATLYNVNHDNENHGGLFIKWFGKKIENHE